RADIYALGSIAFEMITKRLPFVAGSAMEVIALHLMEPPPRPSTLVQGLPREVDDLVVAMLAKAPSERPSLQTIVEVFERAKSVRTELVPIVATASAPMTAVGTPYPSAPVSRPLSTVDTTAPVRKSSKKWLVAPILALAAGGVAFAVVQATTPSSSPTPAPS